MRIHPDVLNAHAQFGGDLGLMQKAYAHHDLVSALREVLGWVRHWQADVAGNLKPTPDSLAMVEAKIIKALGDGA
jgi:hypothetical protein